MGQNTDCCWILRQPGTVTAEELWHGINRRVDSNNQPVHAVTIFEDLPRGTAGKTLKSIVREAYWIGRDGKL